jgi:hypothetical protein
MLHWFQVDAESVARRTFRDANQPESLPDIGDVIIGAIIIIANITTTSRNQLLYRLTAPGEIVQLITVAIKVTGNDNVHMAIVLANGRLDVLSKNCVLAGPIVDT